MSDQKPLKLDQGYIKEFTQNDDLPNQVDIEYLRDLIGRLLVELYKQGIQITDPKLLMELTNNL